ncbi:FCD domain-containing protein [Ancylobacter sp. A5.8]|uniref:FadR/GntR family transcriptional regulator n=1 Tax=Ancylobacter gelatini TaxID=2919920 RepID=UPI001F4F10CA|nr:FCD domain-containing protein [Ancylobacter gelatini]MCJ8145022.1 FCD domain-containing protein [Ancylobacter gelatini]
MLGHGTADDVLLRLRNFLTEQTLPLNGRLPSERALAEQLGATRAEIRKAMAVLESEGQVWRHIGRGTFIGARPVINLHDVEYLGTITSPAQIIDARLAMEPQLARLAALYGTQADFDEMRACNRRARGAKSWSIYEAWDNRLHVAIAQASKNKLLVMLFETLNAVRRSPGWAYARTAPEPPPAHSSFAEHEAITAAIEGRNPDLAEQCMRKHLGSVRGLMFGTRKLPTPPAAEPPAR